ncbi:MAG TPA: class I SAM-dependent methyltransferase [Myxococcota bacterium]
MTDPARAWEERQRSLGCTPRAVLFKGFPGWLNAWLHRRHVAFLLANLPPDAARILDAGCGYGRISLAVKQARPSAAIDGVEPCAAFADAFEQRIGRCYRVPIQEFRPERAYDAILIVTLLLYLSEADCARVLAVLWEALRPGGRLLCIEPAVEIEDLEARIFRRRERTDASSGDRRFRSGELEAILGSLPGASLRRSASIRLLPGIASASLHHCVALEKTTSRSTA